MSRRLLPAQYLTLLDLFSKLSDRQEFKIGRGEISRKVFVGMFAILVAFVNIIAVFGGHPTLRSFVVLNYWGTSLVLLMTLVTEAVNSFLNPMEMSLLAHQPIRDGVYFAAKMTYLAIVVAWIVVPLNLVPALAGLHVQQARWFFPVSYLFSLYLFGIFVAFCLCAVMGILFRIFEPSRLRSLASWMPAATFLMLFVAPRIAAAISRYYAMAPPFVTSANPLNWFVVIATVAQAPVSARFEWVQILPLLICALFIVYGIRSLTEGYMTKVHSLLRSGPRAGRSSRALLGPLIRFLTGRPSGRAAFSFIYAMARTDWNFRSSAVPVLIQSLALLFIPIARGLGPSPFGSARPTAAHLLPHVGGLAGLSVCVMMTFSDQHRAAWIFLTAPLESIRSFVRGIFWALWFPISTVALILLPLYIRYWGFADALLFFMYSLAVGSFYLSVELFLVDGLPFSNPPERSSGFLTAPLVFGSLIVAIIIMALQWLFIFQDRLVTMGTVFVFAGLAYLIAQVSLRGVEVNVLHNLHVIASGRTAMFKELE